MASEEDQRAAEELAAMVSERLTQHLRAHPIQSRDTGSELRVRRMAEIVGPCYTEQSCARLLGLTPTDLNEAAEELRVLRLMTADGIAVFPAFQFHGGMIVPGLQEVLRVLRTGIDDAWTWTLWLTARDPHSPISAPSASNIDRLRAGASDEVLGDVRAAAAAWCA